MYKVVWLLKLRSDRDLEEIRDYVAEANLLDRVTALDTQLGVA
jgi:hypothetical protein